MAPDQLPKFQDVPEAWHKRIVFPLTFSESRETMNTDSTLTGSRPLLKKFFVNASAVIIMDLSVEAASAQEAKEIAKQAYDRWCDDVNGAADTRSDAGPINKPLNGVTSFYSEVVHLDVESPGERTWEY